MQLNKETFEAWLFSQPDKRKWHYCDCFDCLIASFIKETTCFTDPSVGPLEYSEFPICPDRPFPSWLVGFMEARENLGGWNRREIITASNAKAGWTKMFGSPVVSPDPEPCREPEMQPCQ